jgi:hypothetical protein
MVFLCLYIILIWTAERCLHSIIIHCTEMISYIKNLYLRLITTVSRMVLGPTQPPIQCVPGALPVGVKRPGREADYSPPSSAEFKNA